MAKKRTRKSVKVKEQAVLRLLKGEDLELVSGQAGLYQSERSQKMGNMKYVKFERFSISDKSSVEPTGSINYLVTDEYKGV